MRRIRQRDGVYTRGDRRGFWISWRDIHERRRYRRTDARTVYQARQSLAAEKAKVEQAKILGFMPPGEDTFAQVAERFLAFQEGKVTPLEWKREQSIVERHLKPFFAGKASAIRCADVDRFVVRRSSKVSPATVKREGTLLKYILSKAVDWEIIPNNPAQKTALPKPPPGRVRYLQPTELRALLVESPEWLRPIAGIAVTTGMRRGEILNLRWLDIDFPHNRILLPQTKNGEGRIVYLNRNAQAIFASLPQRSPTERIFSGVNPAQVTVAFKRACRKAGIEDFHFHDLRHTAASWLRMQGADIHTVAQMLGHKDLRMAARYQHLSAGFLSDAVNKLDGVFGNLCYQDVTRETALIEAEAISTVK